jgi:hypothetical protein
MFACRLSLGAEDLRAIRKLLTHLITYASLNLIHSQGENAVMPIQDRIVDRPSRPFVPNHGCFGKYQIELHRQLLI